MLRSWILVQYFCCRIYEVFVFFACIHPPLNNSECGMWYALHCVLCMLMNWRMVPPSPASLGSVCHGTGAGSFGGGSHAGGSPEWPILRCVQWHAAFPHAGRPGAEQCSDAAGDTLEAPSLLVHARCYVTGAGWPLRYSLVCVRSNAALSQRYAV